MTSLSNKYNQMDKNLDILDSQDMALEEQLEKDAVAFQKRKNSVLNQSNIQNYWMPESRYALLSEIN